MIKCAWASIDERGKASGGKLGDNNGREVKVGTWYQFGQNVIIRPKNRSRAKVFATAMKILAEGNYVGYDQYNRTSLYNALKKVGFNPKKLKKYCETDCSAMVAACLNVAGYNIPATAWTGNLADCCKSVGGFEFLIGNKYIARDDYLKEGDIILNEVSHVIVALEDGQYAKTTSKSKKYKGALPSHTVNKAQGTIADIKRWQMFLKWYGAYNDAIDGSFGKNTIKGTKKFQKDNGLVIDGSAGSKTLGKARKYTE